MTVCIDADVDIYRTFAGRIEMIAIMYEFKNQHLHPPDDVALSRDIFGRKLTSHHNVPRPNYHTTV